VLSVVALALALSVGIGAGPAFASSPYCNPYPDVDSSNPHCDNIAWLRAVGITKPADGLYHPLASVTRGSMAAFLFRLVKSAAPAPTCTSRPFPDVPVSSTFCGYIAWAKDNHIAYGYPNGSYGPDNAVTRGAMAAYMYRIANPGRGATKCTTRPFRDVPIADAFCGVITWMVDNGITFGVGDGTEYGTTQLVTRQSMASFLHRLADLKSVMPVGQSTEYWIEGQRSARITVENVTRVGHAIGTYGTPPTHTYILVDIKVEAFAGLKNSYNGYWSTNPYNWTIKDGAGYTYGPDYFVDVEHEFTSQDLYPGDIERGTIAFDAPDHGKIVLDPFDSTDKATWKY
jgi:hypothetical protein